MRKLPNGQRSRFIRMSIEGQGQNIIRRAIRKESCLQQLRDAFHTMSQSDSWEQTEERYGDYLTNQALDRFTGILNYIFFTFWFVVVMDK